MVLLPLILLAGCSGTSGDKDASTPPPLFPQPQTVELKASPPIPATPRIIHPDSVAKPQSFAVDHAALTRISAHANRRQILTDLTTIPVDQNQLRTIKVGERNPNFFLVNSIGDTIPTGVPVPATGRLVQAVHSRPTKALPPSTKDAAIAHLPFLNVEHGIPSSLVYAILEDKSGNIWVGSDGGGVSVFNGESFTHYTVNEGLSSNIIWTIAEDRSGNIWIGTFGGGVSVFNGRNFIHYSENEGLSSNTVWTILEDKTGNIWLGTDGGGVSVFNGESFTHYTEKEGLSGNTVKAIMEDSSGNIWLGTDGGGVSLFNGESFTHYTENEGLSDDYIFFIIEDKSGKIWIGTDIGVSVFNGESFTHYTENEGLTNDYINAILEDKSGNIWIGTYGGGVNVFNGESFVHYTKREGLTNDYINAMMVDQSGNIWIGTDNGVNVFNGESIIHYSDREGLSNSYVSAIIEGQNGHIWFGTRGGGVSVFNGVNFTHYTQNEGLSHNYVLSILEDQRGNIWLGTQFGVSVFDGESFIHYTDYEGLSENTVWSMIEDQSGHIWLGSFFGASVFNGESFTHYTENEGLSYNTVYAILEDRSGNIWLGTDGGGVNVFNGESFTHYTVEEGLAFNIVSSILEDKSGNIWLGTVGGGISVFNGTSFANVTDSEGLANNIIWSLVEDTNTPRNVVTVYAGTEKGLSMISIIEDESSGDNESVFRIQNFGKQDGLKALNFLKGAVIDSKSHAWWGTADGLIKLDLNTFAFSDKIPQPRLTRVEVNEQFLDFRNMQDSSVNNRGRSQMKFEDVQRFENYPLNLKLSYDNNHLTLHFVAIDWAAPHKIRYSHRMEGLNTNWSQPNANAVADYRNLSFGTYTFQVRAIGESGEWSEPFEYTFTILPPWWHTWWAYAIYALLFLGALRTFSLWRERRLRQEKEQLQVNVEERTVELKKKSEELEHSLHNLKSTQDQLIQQEKLASLGQLTAGIAHEIKNPLNFVNNFSEVSLEIIDEALEELQKIGENEHAAETAEILADIKANLAKIHQHGSRANGIVQSMLMHSRGGSGKMEPTDLNALIKEYVNLAFHGMRAGKEPINVDIDLQLDESVGEVPLIAEDFSRVILNICNNAFDAMRQTANLSGAEVTRSANTEDTILSGAEATRSANTEATNLSGAEATRSANTEATILSGAEATRSANTEATIVSGAEATRSANNQGLEGVRSDTTPTSTQNPPPKLTVSTKSENGQILIEIEDNGPGIPDEIKDKILQPFFTTKKGTQGTGLGLSITHDIIKAHRGSLEIISEPGKTVFQIQIPS